MLKFQHSVFLYLFPAFTAHSSLPMEASLKQCAPAQRRPLGK